VSWPRAAGTPAPELALPAALLPQLVEDDRIAMIVGRIVVLQERRRLSEDILGAKPRTALAVR